MHSAPSGYAIQWDTGKCSSCGLCAKICSFDAIEKKDGAMIYHKDDCMGCELCVEHCPKDALTLFLDEEKNILPLDIDIAKKIAAG